jgi:hypothetical protein
MLGDQITNFLNSYFCGVVVIVKYDATISKIGILLRGSQEKRLEIHHPGLIVRVHPCVQLYLTVSRRRKRL